MTGANKRQYNFGHSAFFRRPICGPNDRYQGRDVTPKSLGCAVSRCGSDKDLMSFIERSVEIHRGTKPVGINRVDAICDFGRRFASQRQLDQCFKLLGLSRKLGLHERSKGAFRIIDALIVDIFIRWQDHDCLRWIGYRFFQASKHDGDRTSTERGTNMPAANTVLRKLTFSNISTNGFDMLLTVVRGVNQC